MFDFNLACFHYRYVPPHLHLMVFELVKNSLRAVQEGFMDSDKVAPPIRIIVADGIEDVTIKASVLSFDTSHWMPLEILNMLFVVLQFYCLGFLMNLLYSLSVNSTTVISLDRRSQMKEVEYQEAVSLGFLHIFTALPKIPWMSSQILEQLMWQQWLVMDMGFP